MKQTFDKIAYLIGNHVIQTGSTDLLKSEITITVFYSLYNRFISEGILKIEDLPTDEKLKYWSMVKGFCSNKKEEIIKSKAAYALALITSQ